MEWTEDEKLELAGYLIESGIVEKTSFGGDPNWGWSSPSISCTGPSLAGVIDMVSEAIYDEKYPDPDRPTRGRSLG